MSAPVTTLYAALCGLMLVLLGAIVVRGRWRYRVGLGHGNEDGMLRLMRVHANFAEHVPIALLLLLLAELAGAPAVGLHLAGTLLMAGRILHAWGLAHHSERSFGRFWGTLLTWLVIVGLALRLLVAVAL